MLLRRAELDRIASGEVDVVFRRWTRPTVRTGGSLTTHGRVLAIVSVTSIDAADVTVDDARRAGYESVHAVIAALPDRDGALYRVEVGGLTADPRIALREHAELDSDELGTLARRLDQLDALREHPWTIEVLRTIQAEPGRRAPDLAERFGRETAPFKADVRKLKALGLTESLEVGYRLSPRGEAVLRHLT